MLKQAEFDILLYYILNGGVNTQRAISEGTNISLGKVNGIIKELSSRGLIDESGITTDGMIAMKPYKVENAVIMAAGMSSRFVPLSCEKPKGLLTVKGDILIEREIRQLQEAGISDITVIVGYMKEAFFYLEKLYGVKIVVNEDYFKYNNTSSLIRVLDKLSNTYVCSSDNYFMDNVFEPYVYRSYYSAVYAAGETEEYCMECAQNGRIEKVTIGGANSWYMLGHVYFDREFSAKFKSILEREYHNQDTRTHLWEDLYIRYIHELDMYIRKYDAEKVKEFDSLEELRSFDEYYINNSDSKIFENICRTLSCEIKDIKDIEKISAGLTNVSFSFNVFGVQYVYRHPGRGTDKYINRSAESFAMNIVSKLGIDNTFVYMDPNQGWKISRYIKNAGELDYHDPEQVHAALKLIHRLHDIKIKSDYDFDIWGKTSKFITLLSELGKLDFVGFDKLHKKMETVNEIVKSDSYAIKCLCHNACCGPNFVFDINDNLYLLDWEYSGNDDPASDLGTFICCADYNTDEAIDIIKKYLGREVESEELRHYLGYISIASYYWYIWALYQEERGTPVGEWLYLWHKNADIYSDMIINQK